MKHLKLVLALLLVCAFALLFVPKRHTAFAEDGAVSLGGYVMRDFSEEYDGNFVSFLDSDPGALTSDAFCRTTYAAAYYNGYIYGYIYGYDSSNKLLDDFYIIDTANNYTVSFPGGDSGGEFVYAMAYNYADDTMYALCDEDHPYIASVDLKTGLLTRVVDIDLGYILGLRGMAIDIDGNFYALSMSAVNAKLLSVDIETGSLDEIGATGKPAYYAQSITCDPASGNIYWAQIDTQFSNGLYTIDPTDGSVDFLGMIGESGSEITCLYAVYDEEIVEPQFIPGDVDEDGDVDLDDVLLALRASLGIVALSDTGALAADVDESGDVSVQDVMLILRYTLGLIPEL